MRRICCILLLFFAPAARGQVLISLVFGKYLNSGKVEFGLDGGMNLSNLAGLKEGDSHIQKLNLGFYFDIKLKKPEWMFHTGVIVKSTMGSGKLDVYPTGDHSLDSLMSGGHINRKINYFNVPLAIKYITPVRLFFEGGLMPGLRYTAIDEFTNSVNGQDLSYKNDIRSDLTRLDLGILSGIGYRITKGNGINLAIRYYRGLIDITKNDDTGVYNQSIYFAVEIPIGVGKSKNPQSTAP
ncbi:MAG TPA: porin family protein [Bacteroidia bacterium]|nr:porin family protein [Bacteroidia bacterium]